LRAWTKFLADLSSTRIQITYAVVGSYLALLIKGLLIAHSVSDLVALLNVAWPGMAVVLATYLGGKHIEAQQQVPKA